MIYFTATIYALGALLMLCALLETFSNSKLSASTLKFCLSVIFWPALMVAFVFWFCAEALKDKLKPQKANNEQN